MKIKKQKLKTKYIENPLFIPAVALDFLADHFRQHFEMIRKEMKKYEKREKDKIAN